MVAGTRERPEVGVFTQTHARHRPVPSGRIAAGERVWMKWSGGPVVAQATVKGFKELANSTPARFRATTQGFQLHALDDYWDQLPDRFFGLTIYLTNERWLDEPLFPPRLSYSASWVLLDPGTADGWPTTPPDEPSTMPSAPRRAPGASLRFQVLRRDNFTCTYCGRRPPEVELHVDHVVPFTAGGHTILDNLRTACRDCNLGKGASRL